MKKVIFVLCIVLVFVLGGSLVTLADEPVEEAVGETVEEEVETTDMTEYIKEVVIPGAVSIILMFVTMWLSTRPQALNNNALAKQMVSFAQSIGTNKDGAEKQFREMMEKYTTMKAQFENSVSAIQEYKAEMEAVIEQNKKLIEMVRLGFSNNTELVKKGTAKVIYKLGEPVSGERAEVTTDDQETV